MGKSPSSAQGPQTPKPRPRELEDWLNFYLYHRLSMALARALAQTRVTPDVLSVIGGMMIVFATIAYTTLPGILGVVLGLAFHMSWHVFDGADGDLARLTGRSSSRGEVIDGVCDYVGHIIMYVSFGIILTAEVGAGLAWALAIGAGAGRIVQAAHYEVQRRQYQHWVYGTHFLRSTAKRADQPEGILGGFAAYYVWLGRILAPGGSAIDELVAESDDARLAAMRQIIVEQTKPVLRSTYLLSANYRTLAIGASMAAGSPIYFFAFEAIGLTLVLIVSILVSAKAARRISDQAKSLV